MLEKHSTFMTAAKAMSLGICVYGAGAIAAGIMDLVWGNFESAHQPIQAFGDHIPGQKLLAYIVSAWLIVGGAALLHRRTARGGAVALGIVYFIFTVFWLPRFYTAPHVLGFRIPVVAGLIGGVAMQLILVAAAAIVYASLTERTSASLDRAVHVSRWTFGLGSVGFGLVHLTEVPATASMIPKWMPLGADFWAVLTGIAFILAGVAILSGVLDVLAARLLAFMLLIFNALVLGPLPFASPHDHVAWGANAYNLAAIGAVWIFAEALSSWRSNHGYERSTGPLRTQN